MIVPNVTSTWALTSLRERKGFTLNLILLQQPPSERIYYLNLFLIQNFKIFYGISSPNAN